MNNRTLVKIYNQTDFYSLKTVSLKFRSPHMFYISKDKLRNSDGKNHLIVKDGHSFAELIKWEHQGEDFIEIRFTWLSDEGIIGLTAHCETINLPCAVFDEIEGEVEKRKILSIEDSLPKIIFRSRANLKKVGDKPALRRRLGKFLNHHFKWPNYERIEIFDDFLPYSFGFAAYYANGRGICGGIILHGQEDLSKAYYSIHT